MNLSPKAFPNCPAHNILKTKYNNPHGYISYLRSQENYFKRLRKSYTPYFLWIIFISTEQYQQYFDLFKFC